MRWFKHMTGTWQDEKIAELVAEHGFEGYGFYWRTLEIIAANSDENSRYSCQLSAKVWSKLYGISAKRCQKLLEVLAKLRLVRLKISEKIIDISIPNIGKYRDEYSRKSSAEKSKTPDKLRTNSGQTPAYPDTESDTEAETDLDTDTDPSKKIEDTPLNLSPSKGKISADKKQIVEFQKAMGAFSLTEVEKMNVTLLIDAGCKPEDVKTARAKNPDYVKSFKSEYALRQINAARQIRVGEIKTDVPFDAMAWLQNYEPESEDTN